MALTFNSREAVQKLLGRGLPEPAADGIVEVVEDATSPLVTRDILHAELQVVRAEFGQLRAEMRADLYRALWVFGTGMVAAVGVIVGVANALD
ncbi:MAG: hypothetical protein OXS47_06675 [Chloroflexota bacterium]|nr:hypothetical protein [Chloroflexota bacterium]